jgi:hypothetical protein
MMKPPDDREKTGKNGPNLPPWFVEIERSNQALAAITGFAPKRHEIRQKPAKNAKNWQKNPKIPLKSNPYTFAFLAKSPAGICTIFALVLVNLGQKNRGLPYLEL